MKNSICIHILNIENYFPELFALTIKTVELYAKRIKADINIITERKYADWPLLTEKLQVYDYPNYDWNLLIDADILIHPTAPNPFTYFDPRFVGNKDEYKADTQLSSDNYFIRDGRNLGLSGCLLATSRLTHDLWKFPTDLTKEEILDNILTERKIVDEYVVSRNLAKYGLKYKELIPVSEYDKFFHLGNYAQDQNKILDLAKQWMKDNFEERKPDLLDVQLWHSIRGHQKESDELIERLMKERPHDLRVQYNYAYKLLKEGNISEGMRYLNVGRYAQVFGSPPLPTNKPILPPVKVEGKRILINMEGGVGDNIIGLKFAEVLAKDNQVSTIVANGLKPLFDRQSYLQHNFTEFNADFEFDYWLPSMASEYVFGYSKYSELPSYKFIEVDDTEVIQGSVGVKFRGNSDFDHNDFRSPSPEMLLSALEPLKDKFKFYSLEVDDLDLPEWIIPMKKGSWFDTTNFINRMETVVSTCTGVAHVSAGLGKKTLIITPILPFWIWAYHKIEGRLHKSWYYDSVTLFRQTEFEKWDDVLEGVKQCLQHQ